VKWYTLLYSLSLLLLVKDNVLSICLHIFRNISPPLSFILIVFVYKAILWSPDKLNHIFLSHILCPVYKNVSYCSVLILLFYTQTHVSTCRSLSLSCCLPSQTVRNIFSLTQFSFCVLTYFSVSPYFTNNSYFPIFILYLFL
jgi:hypothetical protein